MTQLLYHLLLLSTCLFYIKLTECPILPCLSTYKCEDIPSQNSLLSSVRKKHDKIFKIFVKKHSILLMLNFNLYYTNIAQLAALKCEEFFL